jgi:surface antigen
MLQNLVTSIAVAALVGGGILALPAAAGEPGDTTPATVAVQTPQTQELRPFTHFVRIPADSDPATIRLEKIRSVRLPQLVQYTADAAYCRDMAFRDPGGSMYCPERRTIGTAAAFEATYSYTSQPLASDEYHAGHCTFQVYFRPDELAPEVRTVIETGKWKATNRAEYFMLSTYPERVHRAMIDESQSKFCDGNFVDGNWTHTDPACRDQIAYTTATVLSGYLTVKVDPILARDGRRTASDNTDHKFTVPRLAACLCTALVANCQKTSTPLLFPFIADGTTADNAYSLNGWASDTDLPIAHATFAVGDIDSLSHNPSGMLTTTSAAANSREPGRSKRLASVTPYSSQ